MSTFTLDPALQLTTINDFSPGIVRFGRGSYPVEYTTAAPLGSAASAVRCMVRQGVGLVPFPAYASHMLTQAPANVPSATPVLSGFLAVGPVSDPGAAATVQTPDFSDVVFVAYEYLNAGNRYRSVQLLRAELTPPTVFVVYETNVGAAAALPIIRPVSFTKTRVVQPGAGNAVNATVAWNDETGTAVAFFPNPAAPAVDGIARVAVAGTVFISEVIAHESRIAIFNEHVNNFGATTNFESNDSMIVTDPPEATTFAAAAELFDIENSTGWGAWGSVSTGELALIRGGNGAVIINGDLLAPSSAIKLPGVVGTGRVRQRATETPVGMIYVTEYDGVYLWNGGNTSEKISGQIPDDGFARPELTPVRGITVIHDCLNHLVFFPNNWVYDTINQSWWRCEDPNTRTFAVFSRADYNGRFMWAMTGTPDSAVTANAWNLWRFDMLTPASTWTWISNPIPVAKGSLVDLRYCEIVASNPTASDATITVTPRAPAGVVPIAHANNPQSIVFIVPANSSARRLALPMGFTDYNVQIQISAANAGAAAPTLHEISIAYALTDPTSAV